MKLTGAQIIVKMLENYGIKVVAGIPGGMILPLYNELNRSSIRHILVRHEQAAGFIAQGIARTTGKPAVCMATSGPGAMNLLTSIADARMDSVPVIAITGQVNTTQIGTDAFQEADTFGLSFPITKHSILVKNTSELIEGRKKDKLRSFLYDYVKPSFPVIPYDENAASINADITSTLIPEGKTPPILDTQIASVAIANNLILVTDNLKDFEVFAQRFGLMMEGWKE